MEGFISIPGTNGGLRCLACGAITHEPEAHRERCAGALLAEVERLHVENNRLRCALQELKQPPPKTKWSKLVVLDKPIKFGAPEKKELE